MIEKEEITRSAGAVKAFFTKANPEKKQLTKMDMGEIAVALLPLLVFGILAFGFWAFLVPLLSAVFCLAASLLWDLGFKRQKPDIQYEPLLTGFILGLTLSSKINIILLAFMSVFTVFLQKTFFRKKPVHIIFPALIVRVLFAAVFWEMMSTYPLPFQSGTTGAMPVDYMFGTQAFKFSAKWLFFGLQSGNIGEISEFLLIVAGIYLIIRKLSSSAISVAFVVSVALLSLIFNETISLSLLGGGLFFAALILTMDYGFTSPPLYKKLMYGVFCGIGTFALRKLFCAESAALVVMMCDFVFVYINRRNIKRFIKFCKRPDFKKLLKKSKKVIGF